MIKSPLRYPGGKSKALKFLNKYLTNFSDFREPFFGGGSVSFDCVQNKNSAIFSASEIYYELYCFWSQLKSQKMMLVNEIRKIKQYHANGRELYKEIIARREEKLSDFQRAIDFFILNRITFSGVADCGGYSEASFHTRFTESSIDRLEKVIQVVEKIQILNQDYSLLIQQPGKDVLIFLDPPYYSATKSKLYGKKGNLHLAFDHERLFNELSNCQHRWLMTYDNSDYIQNLYQEFYLEPWNLQYGMNNYKQNQAAVGKELLVANFPLTPLEQLSMTI